MTESVTFPLGNADPASFTGDAFSTMMAGSEESANVKLYYVRFAPGARTNWHAHSGTQILLVTQGRCRYQVEGGPIGEVQKGQSVRFEAGVVHWHGAQPAEGADHIAINIDNPETDWRNPVTEAEYLGRSALD